VIVPNLKLSYLFEFARLSIALSEISKTLASAPDKLGV